MIADLPPIVIHDDKGGVLRDYLINSLRVGDRRIIIDGFCASACTVYLRNPNVCVTDRGVLGFHQTTPPQKTWILMRVYPRKIQRWIRQKGGLGSRLLYLRGADLYRLVKRC